MAHIQKALIFLALYALTVTVAQSSQGGPHTDQGGAHTDQGGPHTNQGRSRRQAQGFGTFDSPQQSDTNWVTCDSTIVPQISCYDCNTKLICKQVGGILKPCNNPFKPHCNNGICSAVPSAQCG